MPSHETRQYPYRRLGRAALLIVLVSVGLIGCDRFVSVETRLERARQNTANGEYRSAMTQVKEALQKDPNSAAARLQLAQLSLALGDFDSAEKELGRAADSGGATAEIRSLQYALLVARGDGEAIRKRLDADSTLAPERRAVLEAHIALFARDGDKARAALDAALAAAPNDPEALLESARLDASRGKPVAALRLPDRLKGVPVYYARSLYLRGAIQIGMGTYREARDTLEHAKTEAKTLSVLEQVAIAAARTEVDLALGDPEAATRSLAGVVQWAPQSVLVHYLRARIALLKRDYEAVVAECQRALKADPQHVQSQLLLASAHISRGALEQAQDTLTRLLASKPDTPAARKLLAQVYLGRNEPEQARRVLGSVASADADANWLLGTALMQSGDSAAAVEHLERGISSSTTDAARRIELASIYISEHAPEQAIDVLQGIPAESPLSARAKVLTVLATASGKPRAEARKEVTELAERNSKDAGLLVAAGSVLASIGDGEAGRGLLQRALALEPKKVDTHLALARLDARERKLDAAQAGLLEVLKLEPANQPAHLALAEIAWTRGDRAASRTWLENAIKADPGALEARLRLAQLSFIQGDGARARSLLDQVLSVSKDRKIALAATGRVLAAAGMSDEALTRFRDAVAAGNGAANLDAARTQLGLNDLAGARQAVQAALATNPQWREARQLRVSIDARDGKVERAFEEAKELTVGASPAALASLRGDLEKLARNFEAAVASYETAQRAQPTPQLAIKLFETRLAGKMGSPERSLTQWLERSPQDSDVRRTLAIYYETSGQQPRALAEYERLVAADTKDPEVLNNLAWALHQKGDARALGLARSAYELAPQRPEIADTYGWILVRMDKVPEGLAVLQKALANAPTNPDILYHTAFALQRNGDSTGASKLVNEALQSKLDFGSRAEAVQLARELTERKPA